MQSRTHTEQIGNIRTTQEKEFKTLLFDSIRTSASKQIIKIQQLDLFTNILCIPEHFKYNNYECMQILPLQITSKNYK